MRWFKGTFDHLFGIVQSPQASEAGVLLSSGYCGKLSQKSVVYDVCEILYYVHIKFCSLSGTSCLKKSQITKNPTGLIMCLDFAL